MGSCETTPWPGTPSTRGFLSDFMNLPVRVGPGDHAENGIEQYGGEIEPLAFGAPMIGDGPAEPPVTFRTFDNL